MLWTHVSWPSWMYHFTGTFVRHSPREMLCPTIVHTLEKIRSLYRSVGNGLPSHAIGLAAISACTAAASLDHHSQYMDGPPASRRQERKKERFYICSDVTHTQTAPSSQELLYHKHMRLDAVLTDLLQTRSLVSKKKLMHRFFRSFWQAMFRVQPACTGRNNLLAACLFGSPALTSKGGQA